MGMNVKETYMADAMWWQILKSLGGRPRGKDEGQPPRRSPNRPHFEHPKNQHICKLLRTAALPLPGRLALGAADLPTTAP